MLTNCILTPLLLLMIGYSSISSAGAIEQTTENQNYQLENVEAQDPGKKTAQGTKKTVNDDKALDHNKRTRLSKFEIAGTTLVMSAMIIRLVLYIYAPGASTLESAVAYTAIFGGVVGGAMKGCLGAQRVSELKEWIKYCWAESNSSNSEFFKKLLGARHGKKEIIKRSALAFFGLWVTVSSGLDGMRIIKQAMLDYGTVTGVFLGIPEIFTIAFTAVEAGYLFARKPTLSSTEGDANGLGKVISKTTSTIESKNIDVIPSPGLSTERVSTPPLSISSNSAVTVSTIDDVTIIESELKKNSNNMGTVYKVAVQNNQGEKGIAILFAATSSYFLISIEQLTALYNHDPANLWISHIVNMLGMGGHLIANFFMEYTNLLEAIRCLKSQLPRVTCKGKRKKLEGVSVEEGIVTISGELNQTYTLCDSASANKIIQIVEKSESDLKKEPNNYISNVGVVIVMGGFAWSEGYYQWTLSNIVKDCLISVAEVCANNGDVMSANLTDTSTAWNLMQSSTEALMTVSTATLRLAESCPPAENICSASQQAFYEYARISATGNQIFTWTTALKAFIFIQEMNTVKHFIRRTKATLIEPFKRLWHLCRHESYNMATD
ncbi:MAG: hypothetical protein QS748_09370 [Candidatus Endonucleobacter bathymodioli]|uniref:Uncharacterized protein n=1 Tax=Candidatus Endonucleibacter bathymodioli TaxID=539814 RepID=A0AA90NUR2_9GAMM|nr:hypothetical protein [Candidatus Endonucleobacter bathymodioli]